MSKSGMTLLLSDQNGRYIPYRFVMDFDISLWGLSDENKEWWYSAENPDSENYWDSWEWILNNAKLIDEDGHIWRLYQDGDLWAVCYELLTPSGREFMEMDE